MHGMCRMRRRMHAWHVSYEEEDTCGHPRRVDQADKACHHRTSSTGGGGYMHVMCHMRRRIHASSHSRPAPRACHVSYEEEDTCMSCVI